MSYVLQSDWTPTEVDDRRFRRHLPGAAPNAMLISLAVAALAMVGSGSAIALKWQQYNTLDTAAIAWQSPVQVSLPPEDFADAEVIHGRLVVLSPPGYAVRASAVIQAPELANTLSQTRETPQSDALAAQTEAVDTEVADTEARHEAAAEDIAPPAQVYSDGF